MFVVHNQDMKKPHSVISLQECVMTLTWLRFWVMKRLGKVLIFLWFFLNDKRPAATGVWQQCANNTLKCDQTDRKETNTPDKFRLAHVCTVTAAAAAALQSADFRKKCICSTLSSSLTNMQHDSVLMLVMSVHFWGLLLFILIHGHLSPDIFAKVAKNTFPSHTDFGVLWNVAEQIITGKTVWPKESDTDAILH